MTRLDDLIVRAWPHLPVPPWLKLFAVWLLRPKFIVGVEALILDDAGRVLVGRHSYRPERAWGPLGGAVERDEDLAVALRREVWEECRLEIEVGPLVAVVRGRRPRRLDFVFRCRVLRGSFEPSTEVSAIAWCTPDELRARLAAPDRWFASLAERPTGAPASCDRVIE